MHVVSIQWSLHIHLCVLHFQTFSFFDLQKRRAKTRKRSHRRAVFQNRPPEYQRLGNPKSVFCTVRRVVQPLASWRHSGNSAASPHPSTFNNRRPHNLTVQTTPESARNASLLTRAANRTAGWRTQKPSPKQNACTATEAKAQRIDSNRAKTINRQIPHPPIDFPNRL